MIVNRILSCAFLKPSRHISTFRQNVLRSASSQSAVSAQTSHNNEAVKSDNNVNADFQHAGSVPTTNTPFAKNLFLGKFDSSVLTFPEISNEEVEELNAMVDPLFKFFTEDVDSKAIDINSKIPDDTLQQIKDLGLFGQQIPEEYGGLGFNATKFARICEVTSLDGSIAVMLAAHQSIGLKGILLAGTEEQKAKYLPKLASGEHTAAFALTEPSSGSDVSSIQTRATLSEDGETFYLNGGKIWITNGGIADIFTVFAKTEITNTMGEKEDKITAFIVERAFGGITNGKPEDKLGIRGSNTCEVHFDNTPVPIENVIGEVGGGFKLAMNILNGGRFSMGSSSAGGLKRLMGMSLDHAVNRTQFGRKLTEFGLIQEKFADLATCIYAMESMSYLTAGIIDSVDQPDLSIEAAMVKVFSSENVWNAASECLQVLGGLGYMKDYPFERVLRDTRIMLIFEGTNEILRMFIALTCLQHAGKELADVVKKMKDPLNNVGFVWKQSYERFSMRGKNPKLNQQIYSYVHPSFSSIGEDLEKRLIRFKIVVENYLAKYRNQIVEEQMALKKMADVATDIYALTSVLSRGSRSLSIGMKNSDFESNLVLLFSISAFQRMDRNLKDLELDKFDNGDEMKRKVAETIFKHGGYAAEHPLTKNW